MELLSGIELTEKAEDYFLGRGAKSATLTAMQLGEWVGAEVSDAEFCKRYGNNGALLLGWYCWPLRTPDSRLVGVEFRHPFKKEVIRHLVHADSDAHAVWCAHPDSFEKLWNGGAVWLVEGLFDLLALEWAVPPTDAVLACGRANLNKKQAESLHRFDPPYVHIVFDRDDAGERGADFATKSLTGLKMRHGKFAYGGGKDPGEIWSKGGASAVASMFGGR